MRMRASRAQAGYTFVELLVVTALLAILASAIVPLTRVASQRQREVELRRALREMRTAIDKHKDAVDQNLVSSSAVDASDEGYPPDLDVLVEGVQAAGDPTGRRKLRFLRRVPVDPMTNSMEWGKRSYQDKPDSRSWGGQNVYDVYTTSDGIGLDGTKYRDW